MLPEFNQSIDAFVLVEDESLRAASLGLVQQIRDFGLNVEYSVVPQKSDKQFKRALEMGALFTARLIGPEEAVIKNLKTREESTWPLSSVAEQLV